MQIDTTDQSLLSLGARVGAELRQRGQTLVTAESCTGGWIAKVLTDAAGSSDYFLGGLVTYANTLKSSLLNVSSIALTNHGAVSEVVVEQMARGGLQSTGADWAIAVSGIAGPEGGSAAKPVGTVWLAWAGPGTIGAARHVFAGDREAVRRLTVFEALSQLQRQMALKE